MTTKVISEGRIKITQEVIDRYLAKREKGLRFIVSDKDTPGLKLIVNPGGATWEYAFRPRGIDPVTKRRWPNKTITLGSPASLSIKDARHRTAAMKGQAAAGDDPYKVHKAKMAKAAADRAATAERLFDDYKIALPTRQKLRGSGLPSPRHVADELGHLKAAIATMEVGDVSARDIGATHLRRLLMTEAARPATARARFGAFSRFMDWVQEEALVSVNPCLAVSRSRRPKPVQARSHYLTPEQLAAMWRAAEKLGPLYRDLVRFLIALPCRRGEATSVDWSHLNLVDGSWAQPGAMTKNGEPHRLHLHPLVLTILIARHLAADKPTTGLVFPAPRSGKPVDTFTDIKASIDKETGLSGWRWHDFRRSFASVLGEAGLPEPVLDACLNHRQSATRGGALGVYQRAQRWPEQVSALKAWGVALSAAIDGKAPNSNVVRLNAAL